MATLIGPEPCAHAAWIEATGLLLKSGDQENLVVEFGPACAIHERFEEQWDESLPAQKFHSLLTVRNTIFPSNLASTSTTRAQLFERYAALYPRVLKHNPRGTYFGRMIGYDRDRRIADGTNQLENVIREMSKNGLRDASEVTLVVPEKGHAANWLPVPVAHQLPPCGREPNPPHCYLSQPLLRQASPGQLPRPCGSSLLHLAGVRTCARNRHSSIGSRYGRTARAGRIRDEDMAGVMTGKYVCLEGIGGCGKSTQIVMLSAWLRNRGIEPVVVKEPGRTPFGVKIRELAIGNERITPLTEAFLFEADRSHTFDATVLPALDQERWVVSDRSPLGTVVFQGIIGGVDTKLIDAMTFAATAGRRPDLAILIDVSAEEAHRRAMARAEQDDKFDARGLAFFERMRGAYLDVAKRYPDRVEVVSGEVPPEQVHESIVERITRLLPEA